MAVSALPPSDLQDHRRRRARLLLGAGALASLLPLVLLLVGPLSSRIEADRSARLDELCGRGARLHQAKLLDEAAVYYVRAEREKASCARELEKVNKEQRERSDAIDNARVERLIAIRLRTDNAAATRRAAYSHYLGVSAADLGAAVPNERRDLSRSDSAPQTKMRAAR